ncbi:diacylglycerol/lipid kinase family protein [Oricola nitratireducens]|uniref:diacylglycerol/lipid kinase family protein n=1 Tax=Oricola nitratireducens TaxID=2775868 RepID=UPI00186716A3|nr:diacylglycerol kinase family protein [Oricola nitratireducens]
MRFSAIINPGASTVRTADRDGLREKISAQFTENGHSISVVFVEGRRMEEALAAARDAPDTEAILAGGGDGTISAAAGMLQGTGKALAVLPGGNMNLYARSLGIPLDLGAAIAALARGRPAAADIAFANERAFIHEFSLGLHPEMIEARDRQRYGSRLGKLVGGLRSLSRTILRPPRVRVWLDDGSGQERAIATAALAISNNRFGEGHLPYTDRIDGGELGVYIAHTIRPAELAAIAARISTGTWAEMPQMEIFTAGSVRLTRRRPMKAAIDGELVKMRGPVDIRIAPGALTVIVPREQDAMRGQ